MGDRYPAVFRQPVCLCPKLQPMGRALSGHDYTARRRVFHPWLAGAVLGGMEAAQALNPQ